MNAKPYTVVTAYREEIEHWRLGPADKALLMAFVWCLKVRMDGNNPSDICGPSHRDNINAKKK